jgi:hypothetical protein
MRVIVMQVQELGRLLVTTAGSVWSAQGRCLSRRWINATSAEMRFSFLTFENDEACYYIYVDISRMQTLKRKVEVFGTGQPPLYFIKMIRVALHDQLFHVIRPTSNPITTQGNSIAMQIWYTKRVLTFHVDIRLTLRATYSQSDPKP